MQGATCQRVQTRHSQQVSIHAPYAGSDADFDFLVGLGLLFQSTPPMQGATMINCVNSSVIFPFQSTPPMQGATSAGDIVPLYCEVSIHAPYAGSDPCVRALRNSRLQFQSTPPMQGATSYLSLHVHGDIVVSIHAPYAGSDIKCLSYSATLYLFQSTPPMQGATI